MHWQLVVAALVVPACLSAQAAGVFVRAATAGEAGGSDAGSLCRHSGRPAAVLEIHHAVLRALHQDAGV